MTTPACPHYPECPYPAESAGPAGSRFTRATSSSPAIDRGSGSVSPEYPENAVADLFGELPMKFAPEEVKEP